MPAPDALPRSDRLTTLLQRFPLQAGVFHVGGRQAAVAPKD